MKTGYLIYMDGVIYRENQLIPGARGFVEAMTATGTHFLFLTNNSAPTAEDQPTRILQSVADLVEEVRLGRISDRLDSPAFSFSPSNRGKQGNRHQTDIYSLYRPRPRPAMTR